MKTLSAAVAVFALAGAVPAHAAFITVDIGAYVNNYVNLHPDNLPIGNSLGNTGTDVPFLVSAAPQNSSYSGLWLAGAPGTAAGTLTVDLSSMAITGQATFYALLNNIYGTEGANEYNITIETTSGLHKTYQAIGGIDTRDYNQNTYTNNIASTTTEWYANNTGQRYDVRVFTLPTAFATETIKSFTIEQVNSQDLALFAGLTFSDSAPVFGAVPEPATWAMMIAGFGLVGAAMRRRNRVAVTFG